MYNRTKEKNMTCGVMTITLIKIIPKTNIQMGKRFRRSVFFRLK